jgi:hypothetical protein
LSAAGEHGRLDKGGDEIDSRQPTADDPRKCTATDKGEARRSCSAVPKILVVEKGLVRIESMNFGELTSI